MNCDLRWTALVVALLGACADDGPARDSESSGNTSDPLSPCEDPESIAQPGNAGPSGFVQCADGRVVREEALDCTSPLAPGNCQQNNELDACQTDDDCGPNGACIEMSSGPGPYCGCVSACVRDADCGEGFVCACPGGTGSCIPASCTTNADCGDGLCRYATHRTSCDGSPRLQCTSAADTCVFDEQCSAAEEACYPLIGAYQCVVDDCA